MSSDLSEKVSAKDVNRRFIRELVHLFLIIKASAVAQVTNNYHEIKKTKNINQHDFEKVHQSPLI